MKTLASTIAIATALALALALTACTTPRELPPGPNPEDVAERVAERVDQAWANTGLEGVIERPDIDIPAAPATFDRLAACIAVENAAGWSLSDGSEGPRFDTGNRETSFAHQLMFYSCFAQYPQDAELGRIRLSAEQLDYLYDYYRDWVIPCLALDSVTVFGAPSREEFVGSPWLTWTPYDTASTLGSQLNREQAIERCGSPYADLEIVDPFGVAADGGNVEGFTSLEISVPSS